MNDTYRRLWILLRERVTKKENEAESFSAAKEEVHKILTMMAEMEAAEFLED